MRRTKANRALTFVMAAALLIGSIHGVGAKEQSKDYDAPELTLVQGASDYDLTAGITYDSEKYILSVTDTGNFDINVVGDYEISYTLTGKENSVKETESVESTEITENTEVTKSTEAVSGTETVADTETGEDTGTLPEGNDSVDGADGADISEPDNADESTDVEEPDGDTVNITEEQTPKAANESQKVINFSRTVKVVAAIICDDMKEKNKIFATARGYGDLKGGWEFPGGKIEAGETPQEALKREIMEELDTKVKIGNLIDTIEYDYPNFHLLMDCFWCEIVSGELKLKEHENAKWLTKEHLDEVEWLPADVILIDKIRMDM